MQAEMMALAALAYTSSDMRPSGESVAAQEARILAGISRQLPTVVPGWEATWVGLTQDRANLAFVARTTSGSPPSAVVGLRGTVLAAIDIFEDVDVTDVVPFSVGSPTSGKVARGAMEAFAEVVMGTSLASALAGLGAVSRLYVTGHSLGGALVTMVAPYLAAQVSAPVVPYTFAGPTAGDAPFAKSFNEQFTSAQCWVNKYDIVPDAWADLGKLDTWFGFFPDTATSVTTGIDILVKVVQSGLGKLPAYKQPKQQPALNTDFEQNKIQGEISNYQEWFDEAAFQHETATYLKLLGGTPIPASTPVVRSIGPVIGPAAGGTTVTITGTGFTASSVVDFGVSPGSKVSVDQNGSRITVVSPPGVGVVDVTVTTDLGTSATSAADQFTFRAA